MTDRTDADDLDLQRVGARLAARAQIRDIRLLRTQAAVHRAPKPAQGLTYDLEFEPAVDADPATISAFVVRISCHLRIQNQAADDDVKEGDTKDETQDVATADFEFAALFDYHLQEGEDDPTEEELTAYAATTGRFVLYPYIREYVYDLTGRLALPPLTLEILSRPMPVSPGAQWPATRGTP